MPDLTTKSKKKLTLKQAKWLSLYIKTGNATQAAKAVYDCNDDSAANIGSENVRKLDIQSLMEEMGLSRPKLLSKLDEGLDSMKQIAARTGNGATAESNDFIEVPDYAVRHKYLETALKLNRTLGPETLVQNNIGGDMKLEFIQGDK